MPTSFEYFRPVPQLTPAELPSEDRFAFESLSTSDSEFSTWADACESKYRQRVSELETYIATIRSLRNTYSPTSRLPNEILAHIFAEPSLALQTSIRSVCRRWCSVLLASPSFWAGCVSKTQFDASLGDQTFLRAALEHSGALPISIDLKLPYTESTSTVWDTLLEHHTRITELSVDTFGVNDDGDISPGLDHLFHFGRMEMLHRLSLKGDSTPFSELRRPDWNQANLPALRTLLVTGVGVPCRVVASLTTLGFEDVYLASAKLLDVLNECPLLESLYFCHNTLRGEGGDIEGRAICLPRLREVTIINERTWDIHKLLDLFKLQRFSIRTIFTLRTSIEVLSSTRDRQLLGSLRTHRTCIELYEGYDEKWCSLKRASSDSKEDLRLKLWALDDAVKSRTPPISALIVNSTHMGSDSACCKVIEDWDSFPHLKRLEIAYMYMLSKKCELATGFLNRSDYRAQKLSLAWVLPIVQAKQETQSLAEADLQGLLGVLRGRACRGGSRLGRLELYAIERAGCKTFDVGSIEAGSDTRLCSQIVEPFLAELKKWVDVVHVG